MTKIELDALRTTAAEGREGTGGPTGFSASL